MTASNSDHKPVVLTNHSSVVSNFLAIRLSATNQSPATPFVIYLKDLMDKVTTIPCDPEMTVERLKECYYENEGVPARQQRIIFAGR